MPLGGPLWRLVVGPIWQIYWLASGPLWDGYLGQCLFTNYQCSFLESKIQY